MSESKKIVQIITSSYEQFQLMAQLIQDKELEIEILHQKGINNRETRNSLPNSAIILHDEDLSQLKSYISFIEQNQEQRILVLTDFNSVDRAVDFMKSGARSVVGTRQHEKIIEELLWILSLPKREIKPYIDVFQKLTESVDFIAIQGYNYEGELIYWSPGSEKLYGFTKEEALHKKLDQLIIPNYLKNRAIQDIQDIINKNIPSTLRELTLQKKTGEKITILTNYIVEDNNIFFIDVNFSLQNEIQKRIELERTYFETLFESSPLAITVLDNEDRFINCNRQFEILFGYNRDEIKGLKINDLIVPEHLKEEGEELTRQVALNHAVYKETVRKTRFGNLIDVAIIGKPVFLQGNKISVLGIYQDISTRKDAERALLQAKQQAEANDKLKTSFLNIISHEIRTPLNGIVGFINLLISHNPDEETKRNYYNVILKSCDRLLNTITNYIDASLLLSNNVTLQFEEVSVVKILLDIHATYYEKILEKNIDLILQIPDIFKTKFLKTDPHIVHKILSHLIDNAIKHTNYGHITLGVETLDASIRLYVENTGTGIPKEDFEKLFKQFSKIEKNYNENQEGSGLSLSISKEYANLLGADLIVESEVNQYARFSLTFPQSLLIEKTAETAFESWMPETLNPTILLVDDDPSSLLLLSKIISHVSDITILEAQNGKEAIDKFTENGNIIAVFMDLKMPIMDGYVACQRIKELNPAVPVYAITAFGSLHGNQSPIATSGCNGCITKPFSINQIINVLKQCNIPIKQ
ncbi:MAG TPA: PAS domain S-box protein [Salinivirgaceae bacterium]|nr:PAS domain S-box protein [Salinivirgaceae bacterium]